jgi:hypothetical protein
MKRLSIVSLALLLTALTPLHAADNTLTAQEKAAGWQLLFDGKTFNGWRGYRQKAMPAAGWAITDGLLQTAPGPGVKAADIVTEKRFGDFELVWDWKIPPGGNNGVKYFVREEPGHVPGPEYQMIDDTGYPGGNLHTAQLTAAFYEVIPAAADKPLRKAGEWNTSRIVVRGNRVEHWLNGANVLTYEPGSAEVKAGVAKSKFAKDVGFGEKFTGPIMLTYHNDKCWFRNIKIRELK